MQKITDISGKTIPLAMNDVDTDLIIPAQYLTSVTQQGYGENLFRRLRDNDKNFVFNQPKFAGATVLIAQKNFGCGSSREHAVWALQQAGIQAIIAESFADIFFSNSAKNGLVLIAFPQDIIQKMINLSGEGDYYLTIDLVGQNVTTNDNEIFHFNMDPFQKHCFMNGLDQLDYLLSHGKEIDGYKKAHQIIFFEV